MKYYLIIVWFSITLSSIAAQAPTWVVNANDFQYNVSVTAEIKLDFITNHDAGNLVAAFVNEELRGVAAPTMINDSAVYFLTIFSNVLSGEEVFFEVYLQGKDSIFQAVDILPFENNLIVGDLHYPLEINISSLGDFPISILPFPNDTTLVGYDFAPISFTNQLIQLDNDEVIWSAFSSAHLLATVVNNDQLLVSSNDPNWYGTESVSIIASEIGNSQMYSDTQEILLTILPDFIGPVFNFIPLQLADENNVFPISSLAPYMEHDGSCLYYEMEMISLSGNDPYPNWSAPPINGNSMNLVLQLSFNDSLFHDTGIIAGFIEGQLAGLSEPIFAGGNAYYFLTLSDVATGNISFQFYDSGRNFLYTMTSEYSFISAGSLGTVSKPEVIDISPIKISLNSLGDISATLIDNSFDEVQHIKFTATDCDFPIKSDTTFISFTKNQCTLADIEICPGEAVCVQAPPSVLNVTWFKDNIPIWSDSIFSITEPGQYNYQGITIDTHTSVGCLLKVIEAQGCLGDFDSTQYSEVVVEMTQQTGIIIFDTLESDIIPFRNTWTGNGDNISWHDPSNWDSMEKPCPCQHVVIPGPANVIHDPGLVSHIWRLTTQMNAVLTVENNSILSVRGY